LIDLNEISDLMEVFERSKFNNIEFKKGDLIIKLSVDGAVKKDTENQSKASLFNENEGKALAVNKEEKVADNYVIVKSETVGTFYESPSPGANPFVRVGDYVEKGQQIGLIEVMKLFTPIESPVNGIVEEIHINNSVLVEYGETLITIVESVE